MSRVSRRPALLRSAVAVLLLGLVCAMTAPAAAADRIGPRFFGVDLSISPAEPWPGFAPGVVRSATAWASIERSPGVYDWASLDAKVQTAESHGARPLLVMEGTPSFHALGPDEPTYGSAPRLEAYSDFVRALVARYRARVDYQVWNEGNVPGFFLGTPEQLGEMTLAASRAVDDLAPGATLVAASFPTRFNRIYVKRYWGQTPGGRRIADLVDAAAVSAYPMLNEGPEAGLKTTGFMRRLVTRYGFDGPLWATEINYGANGLESTPQVSPRRAAAFVVQTYVLQANLGADRVYWWRWEPHQTVNTQLQDGRGNLTRAGKAFGVVKDWIVRTKAKGCDLEAEVRVCRFRGLDGTDRLVAWTASGKKRTLVTPKRSFARVRVSGAERRIRSGQRVRVGEIPVMIRIKRR